MRIGRYNVHLLTLGTFRMDGGGLFGIIPKKLWLRVYPHVDEDNRVLMAAKALLVIGEGVVLVADAGLGEKLDSKMRSIFCVEQPADALVTALAVHGITADQVTHFVYTHLHFDHAGGATGLNADGIPVPLFQNAKHYLQRKHLEWAENPSDKDRASFNPQNWRPVLERGQLELLTGTHQLLPGIDLLPVHGHTPAMQMVKISDGESGLVYTIDLFPTVAHITPHYVAAFDNYPLLALEEKRTLLSEAAAQRLLIGFGHDPMLAAVTVRARENGFEVADRFTVI